MTDETPVQDETPAPPRPLTLRDLASGLSAPHRPAPPPRRVAPLLAPSRVEDLAGWLAAVQDVEGLDAPRPLRRPRLVVLAGDHGVAAAEVSRHPAGWTTTAVHDLLAGRGPVAALLAGSDVGLAVHAVSLDVDEAGLAELPEPVRRHAVRRSSEDARSTDAMTQAEAEAAVRAGAAIADDEIDAGADLLLLGSLGVGATTVAAALVAACLRKGAVDVVGRGSGIDDDAWMRKTAAIRDAVRRARPFATRPVVLLQTIGSPDLAAAVGFVVRAATRRTPVLLDGVVGTAAALVASRGVPGVENWCRLGARSAEPAQQLAADRLKLDPLLDLGAGLGGGTGALLALPLLRAAQALAVAGPRLVLPPEPAPVEPVAEPVAEPAAGADGAPEPTEAGPMPEPAAAPADPTPDPTIVDDVENQSHHA